MSNPQWWIILILPSFISRLIFQVLSSEFKAFEAFLCTGWRITIQHRKAFSRKEFSESTRHLSFSYVYIFDFYKYFSAYDLSLILLGLHAPMPMMMMMRALSERESARGSDVTRFSIADSSIARASRRSYFLTREHDPSFTAARAATCNQNEEMLYVDIHQLRDSWSRNRRARSFWISDQWWYLISFH